MPSAATEIKNRALERALRGMDAAVVAYSGGVDSTYLAAVAHRTLGVRALAVTASSPALAGSDLRDATQLAAQRGWRHTIVETHELDRAGYSRNGPDRCFWCKTELLEVLEPLARRAGAEVLVGTNADDLADYRPGRAAAAEKGALTPLADAGLTKAEIRELSVLEGLPTAERPASPCLSSRFAYGVTVTSEGLRRVERAEEIVRALGFEVLRVRDHGDLARIEVPAEQISRAAALRETIASELSSLGFRFVTLDLTGFRSGSLNEVLEPPAIRGPHPPHE